MVAKKGDDKTRKAALEAMPRVCRTGTHLFQFVEAMQSFGGWGRGTKRTVANWYTSKDADKLAYQLVKYRQRNGWSHKDTILLAHPGNVSKTAAMQFGLGKPVSEFAVVPSVIQAFQQVQAATSVAEVVRVIAENPSLPWEAIPSDFLKSPDVWRVLLANLPMTALIRNLGRMTANGAIEPMSDAKRVVTERLS